MSFYVYIIKSEGDGTYYKGITSNYYKRISEHNKGCSKYTRNKIPWKLIYVEVVESKHLALIREKRLKKCKADYFEWLVQQPTNLLNNDAFRHGLG